MFWRALFLEKSGNKWTSRDLTGLPKFFEINGNLRKLKDFKGISVTRKIYFSLKNKKKFLFDIFLVYFVPWY
jgi:hypothetical protein